MTEVILKSVIVCPFCGSSNTEEKKWRLTLVGSSTNVRHVGRGSVQSRAIAAYSVRTDQCPVRQFKWHAMTTNDLKPDMSPILFLDIENVQHSALRCRGAGTLGYRFCQQAL
jgi:hypothetical protein